MMAMDDDDTLNPESGAVVKAMWSDPGVQATWELRAEYQVCGAKLQVTPRAPQHLLQPRPPLPRPAIDSLAPKS